jgi:hypothetical protein
MMSLKARKWVDLYNNLDSLMLEDRAEINLKVRKVRGTFEARKDKGNPRAELEAKI